MDHDPKTSCRPEQQDQFLIVGIGAFAGGSTRERLSFHKYRGKAARLAALKSSGTHWFAAGWERIPNQ